MEEALMSSQHFEIREMFLLVGWRYSSNSTRENVSFDFAAVECYS